MNMVFLLLTMGGTASAGSLAVDSSQALHCDTLVHAYTLQFYDTAWKATLEANWLVDGGYVPARFTDGTTTLDSVGVRYKGNSSYTLAGNSPKKPFKIKFNAFRTQTYYGAKVLNFSNVIGDPSFLREKISYDIASRFLPSPRSSFATLSVDTRLVGLYTQVEDVDKTMLKRWYATATGNLYKAGDDGASLAWLGATGTLYSDSGTYELKTNETANDWTGFVNFADFLNNASDSVFCADHPKFLDADNVTKELAFNMVFSNFDSYTGSGRNYYLYQTATGPMHILPWDLNLSFGAYGNGWDVINQDLLTVSNLADRPLNRRVLGCLPLRYRYLDRVRTMILGAASTDSVNAHVARLAPVIRPFVAADSNKFYSTAAFETNLTANFRNTSGVILGLEAFSKARNAKLLAQVDAYLPAGYVGVKSASHASKTVKVRRQGGAFVLGAALEDAHVLVATIDGRKLGELRLQAGRESTLASLPHGIVVLKIRTASAIQTLVLNNL
ncbi:MAG: Inner spore coat protein [Fibrobacterota bacterium]|jgi:hypothetical protein